MTVESWVLIAYFIGTGLLLYFSFVSTLKIFVMLGNGVKVTSLTTPLIWVYAYTCVALVTVPWVAFNVDVV